MNKDLISREALFEKWTSSAAITAPGLAPVMMMTVAKNLPAVDAVEVIRCKDCRHTVRSKMNPATLICTLTKMCGTTDPDFYCANGARHE